MNMMFNKAVEIDEASIHLVKSIDQHDYVELSNDSDAKIDEKKILDHLQHLEGREKVESLTIHWRSNLSNVEVVKAFPNLRYLSVYGRAIRSLKGLSWFQHGEFLEVSTDKNHKRTIEQIAQVPIPFLYLGYGCKEDISSIGGCTSLKKLTIERSPIIDFDDWSNVPLEHLKFMSGGKFTELGLAPLSKLTKLDVGGCRKFEQFTGSNASVRRITIDTCRAFDVRSLTALTGLEHVLMHTGTREVKVSELPEHQAIRSIMFMSGKVTLDTYDLKKKMPKLEKFCMPRLKKDQLTLLAEANPDVSFEYE